jgi:hypothetical protein
VPTFVDRGMSRGQRGGSPMAIKLSFLDRPGGDKDTLNKNRETLIDASKDIG